jgi:hypothetical protein
VLVGHDRACSGRTAGVKRGEAGGPADAGPRFFRRLGLTCGL